MLSLDTPVTPTAQLAQAAGGIGWGRHCGGFPVARRTSGDVYRRRLRDARTGV